MYASVAHNGDTLDVLMNLLVFIKFSNFILLEPTSANTGSIASSATNCSSPSILNDERNFNDLDNYFESLGS